MNKVFLDNENVIMHLMISVASSTKSIMDIEFRVGMFNRTLGWITYPWRIYELFTSGQDGGSHSSRAVHK